jgi:hypothetical protein
MVSLDEGPVRALHPIRIGRGGDAENLPTIVHEIPPSMKAKLYTTTTADLLQWRFPPIVGKRGAQKDCSLASERHAH